MGKQSIFDVFTGHDRYAFPKGIERVSAGHGGEAILIIGSEKTALYDCGMAYAGAGLVENIRQVLHKYQKETLDYVILSHSHYDHVGALPYVRNAYPHVTVFGGEYCQSILPRSGARAVIKELGTVARNMYAPDSTEEILIDGLSVDQAMTDGSTLSLGDVTIVAIETKGHTNCSMSYGIEPFHLLLASESTGLIEAENAIDVPVLKSFADADVSLEKCRAYDAKELCLPHFGLVPSDYIKTYWERYEKESKERRDFICQAKDAGMGDADILDAFVKKYWNPVMQEEQPMEAFLINAKSVIRAALQA